MVKKTLHDHAMYHRQARRCAQQPAPPAAAPRKTQSCGLRRPQAPNTPAEQPRQRPVRPPGNTGDGGFSSARSALNVFVHDTYKDPICAVTSHQRHSTSIAAKVVAPAASDMCAHVAQAGGY